MYIYIIKQIYVFTHVHIYIYIIYIIVTILFVHDTPTFPNVVVPAMLGTPGR
jgi:hypothetical protein